MVLPKFRADRNKAIGSGSGTVTPIQCHCLSNPTVRVALTADRTHRQLLTTKGLMIKHIGLQYLNFERYTILKDIQGGSFFSNLLDFIKLYKEAIQCLVWLMNGSCRHDRAEHIKTLTKAKHSSLKSLGIRKAKVSSRIRVSFYHRSDSGLTSKKQKKKKRM